MRMPQSFWSSNQLPILGWLVSPNAGKSTLLRAISSAQPKVAEYAFTTISPQLGAVSTDGGISSFVVADIPGLIEGAHENRGLGHNFLRHVERCAAFVYVVDLGAGAGGRPGVRPWNALQTLMAELEAYLPGLSARPAIVVGTKADLPHSSRAAETLTEDNPAGCYGERARVARDPCGYVVKGG